MIDTCRHNASPSDSAISAHTSVVDRAIRLLGDFARDLRQGLHLFRRRPGLTVAGVLTMGFGIGASVTVFSFIDSVFFKPLPVAHADRLVRLYIADSTEPDPFLSFAAYQLLRTKARAFDAVIAHYSTAPLYVTADGESEELEGAVVSANYFPALGIRPFIGRFFSAQEDAVPDRDAVAVIGYGLWQRRFGADPNVIGRTIRINQRDFQIIGVAPAGFNGIIPSGVVDDIWVPTMMLHTGYRWCDALRQQPVCEVPLQVLARRAPGVSLAAAQVEVSTLARQLATLSYPPDSLRPVMVERAVGVGEQNNFDLIRLLIAVATFILVIACSGLSGLLLASATTRQTELAVRTSLGARRLRLVRQLLTESTILAVAGGAAGLLVSVWGVRALSGLFKVEMGDDIHLWFNIGLDVRVLMFAIIVSLLAAVILGIAPAVQGSRTGPAARLERGAQTGARTREVLIGVQVAVSVVMLIGAALLTKSFARLRDAGGFDPRHVMLLRLRPLLIGYTPDRAQVFLHRALERLRTVPQVDDVAFTGLGTMAPIWGAGGEIPVRLPGQQLAPGSPPQRVQYQEISPRFFATLHIPLLVGREFTDQDRPGSPRVAIVDDLLARRLWPRGDALGRTVVLDSLSCQVVGVVRHYGVHTAIQSPPAMAFVPYWQNDFDTNAEARLAVRVQGNPTAALPAIKRAIAAADPAVPITETLPLVDQMSAGYGDIHISGSVLLMAAALAVCLSAIALYGITAFFVAESTREIGIRLAIGATPPEVVMRFLRRSLRAAAVGGAIGLVLSLFGTRLLGAWLVGVRPLDPFAFIGAALVVSAAAALACYFPARRAARVDPIVALRDY